MVRIFKAADDGIRRLGTPALIGLVAGLALLPIAACERGPQGIFYSVATAQEIVEGNLPKDAIVNGMVEVSSGDDYYFAAVGGRVWYRRADGDETDWRSISNPPRYRTNHSRPTSIVNLNGTIYVSFVEGERERSDVYELVPDPVNRGYSQDPIDGGFTDGIRIISRLFALDDRLFASIQHRDDGEDAEYELWYLGQDGDSIDLVSGVNLSSAKPDVPYISATSDDNGSFWFITTKQAFHTDDPVTADSLANVTPPDGALTTLGGIFFHVDTLYLSSRTGRTVAGGSQGVISSTSALPTPGGADWSSVVSTSNRAYTDFAFAQGFPGIGDALLVGTYRTRDGTRVVSTGGFLELQLDGDGDIASVAPPSGSSYVASELSTSAVMQIFVPQNASDQSGTMFALTGGRGLWRGIYGTDGEARWIWE